MSKYNKLNEKKVVIIGGSSGIGFCVAEACLEFGASVVIASSSQPRIDSALERLSSPKATGYAINLKSATTEQELESLFEKTGKIDHLVWTAGDALPNMSLDGFAKDSLAPAFDIRFTAFVLAVKVLTGKKLISEGGSITFSSGLAGAKPQPGWFLTSALCGANFSLASGLAVELSPLRVRVNCVSPGAVLTELWDGLPKEARDGLVAGVGQAALTGSVGMPEDVAQAYLYAMRDGNLTGQVIETDGGIRLR
ncbi:NAD(P)-binding protein [Saitoella complicata NRRL Y-17804]|uniref:Uncharacterized protein n=1 Tax=Saitoella complicata (strain BCRC 22490 / CBS 7301 / JCM 7358 / NBRC 10748 / NRRL Y-17804) TaxID=698492 RepID=A0A0E9NN30_SAICN|nr:NAD(P)-binding protein [Saitoella complicata NRRL Y-17804]ODQ50340.1 NAD(P)-binding protein [Saitoella complicata NRRL Y-17804]GAO51091.1 hypothetical protein G7K_5202-t1 [Saitoella complicata NRRL Y-17804]